MCLSELESNMCWRAICAVEQYVQVEKVSHLYGHLPCQCVPKWLHYAVQVTSFWSHVSQSCCAYAGTTVPGAEITQERNKEECLHKCVALDACDTALFNYRTKDCHALVSDTDASPQFTMDWETLRECMGGEPTGATLSLLKTHIALQL